MTPDARRHASITEIGCMQNHHHLLANLKAAQWLLSDAVRGELDGIGAVDAR